MSARKKTERQLREALSLAGDMMTLDDLVAMAQIGRMQVWGDDEGVIATTIDHWPRGKLLHIYAGAAHDFGVRKLDHPCSTWTARCVDWLRSQRFLEPSRE